MTFFKKILFVVGILLLISAASAAYFNQYPSAYSSTYVKSNSSWIGTPDIITNPANSLTGAYQWLGNAETNRINLDLGTSHTITHCYYENHHSSGGETTRGVKNFTIWGSNSESSFKNINTTDDTGWTQLTPDVVSLDQHTASNVADPKFFNITNTNGYRYYSIKFTNSWGAGGYTTLRRFVLQTEGSEGLYDSSLLSVLHFNNTLGNPANFTDDNGILWTLSASAGHNPYINSTSPKFGNGSVWFYGATDASTVSVINDTQRVWGSSNHTMEFQYFPISTGTDQALIYQSGVFMLRYDGTAKGLKVYLGNGWDLINGETSTANGIPLGQWSHIEVDYAYPSFKIYVNGMLNYSKTLGGTIPTSTSGFSIGYISGNNLYGGIDEFAEWSSTRHMANFTPPTTEYLPVALLPPVSSFTANVSSGTAPLAVKFTDTSTNTPTSWIWNFTEIGNSTPVTFSVLQNPEYIFPSGNYSIKLSATNAFGSNITGSEYWINSTPPQPPTASFIAVPNPARVDQIVSFTDTSTYSPLTWDWNFGDGSANVTIQNPVHSYAAFGTYPVFLNVSNAVGSSHITSTVTVTNKSGYNQQDLILDPIYTLILHVTVDSTNLPIPTSTIISSTGESNTTVYGTATLWFPYSVATLYIESDGYRSVATSYVMDRDREETVQLTVSSALDNYAVTYPPKDIRFHVQTLAGKNIPTARVIATPYLTTLGSYTFVADLFGYDFDKVPLANLTLSGYTDSRGDITFAMMTDVQYELYTNKSGYTFHNFTMTPHDDNYIIYADQTGSLFVTNGTAPAASVTYVIRSKRLNATSAVINISYDDVAGATNAGIIRLHRNPVNGT